MAIKSNYGLVPGLAGLFLLLNFQAVLGEPIFEDSFEELLIAGKVEGHDPSRAVIVTLQSVGEDRVLQSTQVDGYGRFRFSGFDPSGQYAVRASQRGRRFLVDGDALETQTKLQTDYLLSGIQSPAKQDVQSSAQATPLVAPGDTALVLTGETVPGLDDNHFVFRWAEDVSVSGAEYSSYVNRPLDIEFLGSEISDVDSHAPVALLQRYGILLVDDELAWSPEHAFRLLQSIERTGIEPVRPSLSPEQRQYPYKSRWTLTDEFLHNDIDILVNDEFSDVRVSSDAFTYASPMVATVDGKRGNFFSNRLFKAAVRFITDNGNDIESTAGIVRERYGINIASDENFDGRYLTVPVIDIDRDPKVWQRFSPHEAVELIAMLEEFPETMRDISFRDREGGLRHMLRRRNGLLHPWYPEAPAVAWPSADYVEFMDFAFEGQGLTYIQRLIIHEKAHFIWDYLLTPELKYEWLKMSGWYRPGGDGDCEFWSENRDVWEPPNVSPDDLSALTEPHELKPLEGEPNFSKAWASCSTTQFVTAYAAQLNPNEDMAESIAFFMTNPDALRSRALPKYQFIRDFIMQGSIFVSLFREDLTFEVFNLYPDYIYPGKINRVEIDAYGDPDEDKTIEVEIGLHVTEDCDELEAGYCLDGAAGGRMRLFSRVGTFKDVFFYPKNGDVVDRTLTSNFKLPFDAADGWWYPENIVIFDRVGNQRIEKLASNDLGWRLYVDNAEPDLIAPQYVPASMQVELLQPGDPAAFNKLGDGEQELFFSWRVIEKGRMGSSGCFIRIVNYSTIGSDLPTSFDQWGHAVPLPPGQVDGADYECRVHKQVSRYLAHGDYGPGFIDLHDLALNQSSVPFVFDHAVHEDPPTVFVETPTPDTVPPVLDISVCQTSAREEKCLRIDAEPVRPDNPDGETIVQLSYWAYEDQPLEEASGLAISTVVLRDPQGQEFFYFHGDGSTGISGRAPLYGRDPFECPPYTLLLEPECDATTPVQYVFESILPQGSAPGTWGLVEMTLRDMAGNISRYQFTETLRFDVDG